MRTLIPASLPDINGTSKIGEIKADYETILKAFGDFHFIGSADFKTQYTWAFKLEDGGVLTIYDYKERDDDDRLPNNITKWSVGGKNIKEKIEPSELLQEQIYIRSQRPWPIIK